MEVLFPGQHFHTMELDKTMEVGFSNLFLQYFQHIQSTLWKRSNFSSVSQSCAVAKSDNFWRATGQSNLPDKGWPQQKFPKFDFRIHTTPLWPMEQSSSLVVQWTARMFYLRMIVKRIVLGRPDRKHIEQVILGFIVRHRKWRHLVETVT